ncbi:hypothetical protein BaRGS_00036932 [Batillaria attramentaria]|uniref:Cytochrome P450 n=1 Tax=Batillaria attramentaria TaxID=370345 RepID=A0ABD0JAC7_9CAEN
MRARPGRSCYVWSHLSRGKTRSNVLLYLAGQAETHFRPSRKYYPVWWPSTQNDSMDALLFMASDFGVSVGVSLLLGTVLTGAAVCLLYRKFAPDRRRFPPGPRGLSALLTASSALKSGTLHKQAKLWYEQYGELVLCRTLIGDLCFLNSARLVRQVFASKELEQFTNDRPRTFTGWYTVYNYSDVITGSPSISPEWVKVRKLFHYALKFYGDGVEQFEGTMQTELRRLMATVEETAGEEIAVDKMFTYSLLCVLNTLLTGKCPSTDSEMIRIMKTFDQATAEAFNPSVDGVLNVFPFLRFVPGSYYRELCVRMNSTRDIESHTPGKPRGIVDILLDEQAKEENGWMTDNHIRGLITNTIAAGFLTSVQSLKGILLHLAHEPEVMRKLQKEIDTVIGQRPPAVGDRSNLPYAEAVMMEGQRYDTFLPLGLVHEAREEISVDGYCIPKGSLLFANAWVFRRDPEVWGDPEVFRPERFLDDVTGQLLEMNHPLRKSLLAFGVGRRNCPGENFARTRIFLYITTLLQKFDVLPPVKHDLLPAEPDSWENSLVLKIKEFYVIFRPRSD